MRGHALPALALCFFLSSSAHAAPELATEDDKIIYALGLAFAQQLEPLSLSPEELEVFKAGLSDKFLGKKAALPLADYVPKFPELRNRRLAAAAEGEKKASQAFLAAAAAEPGAQKTDSGLIYRETLAGSGERPSSLNEVKVHYHGTLRDGTVFDSSVERGEPHVFPLNRVIACWTEALQLMQVGAKATITCPAEIAYGDRGAGEKIKPGAALRFDVELLGIEK